MGVAERPLFLDDDSNMAQQSDMQPRYVTVEEQRVIVHSIQWTTMTQSSDACCVEDLHIVDPLQTFQSSRAKNRICILASFSIEKAMKLMLRPFDSQTLLLS